MSKNKKGGDGVPIDNLLYTTEGVASAERAKEELEVKDPSIERALGVLNDGGAKPDE